MDPNENLAEQRRICERLSARETSDPEEYESGDVDDWQRLAELAHALDEWLSGGGFLPEAWKRPALPFVGQAEELLAIRCPACTGLALHTPVCPLRADPLPWEPKP